MRSKMQKKLYEVKWKELGCQCVIEPYLGDILTENPDCKYHNWLEQMFNDGEDVDRLITVEVQ